jgi:hypothetical protein
MATKFRLIFSEKKSVTSDKIAKGKDFMDGDHVYFRQPCHQDNAEGLFVVISSTAGKPRTEFYHITDTFFPRTRS